MFKLYAAIRTDTFGFVATARKKIPPEQGAEVPKESGLQETDGSTLFPMIHTSTGKNVPEVQVTAKMTEKQNFWTASCFCVILLYTQDFRTYECRNIRTLITPAQVYT